jgi:pimeloyl-ACP methyl ester carboxylesterase
MRPDRTGTVDAGDAALYFEETGAGVPVVFLHGFGLDLRMWDEQVDALAGRRRVIRYDLRGFGRSTPGTQPYRHADDLRAVLDHLVIDRAFLIGLSLGGGAIVNAAVMYPERVLGLVAVDPSLGGFTWSTAQMSAMKNIQARAGDAGIEAARARWLSLPIFRTLASNPAADARFRAIVGDYSGWHWQNTDRGLPLTPPAIDRLQEIAAPTLVLVGERDTQDFQQIATTLERGIPNARKIILPGVGHMANMEAPDVFNAAIIAFLDSHAP